MICATVMREDGRRMSKSLGTGVDPTKVIGNVGADALRWTLLSQSGENQELRYSERKTEEARNFANKIWNATRFVLLNVDQSPSKPASFEIVDRWLLSQLYQTEQAVRSAYDSYNFQEGCQALYRFFWNEVCDWYLEICKPRSCRPLAKGDAGAGVFCSASTRSWKMLHPVMPHLTEELYAHLPLADKSPFLMSAAWPSLAFLVFG